MNRGTSSAAVALLCLAITPMSADASPPRGARSATLAGGTAARSGAAASTARGGTPCATEEFVCYSYLGATELRLGKFQAAAEHLAHSLTLFPVNGSPDAKAKTEGLLEEAKKEVGTLRLTVTPPGALVKIGGQPLGPDVAQEQVFVEPGEMRVEAGGVDGYEGASQSVKVAKGQVVNVALALTPRAKPTASGTATAGPAATGVPVADPLRTPLIVSGIAVTAATLGVGIGLLVGGMGKKGEADQLRTDLLKSGKTVCGASSPAADCGKFTDATGTYATLTNAGGGLMIAGGLLGAATVIYAVVSRPRATVATAPPRVFVSVGPSGAALGISGSY